MAKTYSTVPDKSVGNTFTEAMWDDYIKTNINNLMTPPACRAYITTNMSLTAGVPDSMNLGAEAYDTDTMWTTPDDHLTIKTAGIYVISAFWAPNTGNSGIIALELNASATLASNQGYQAGGFSACAVHNLAVNDEIRAIMTAATTDNIALSGAYLSACWIGRTS